MNLQVDHRPYYVNIICWTIYSLVVFALILATIPSYDLPPGFDGNNYLLMAMDLKSSHTQLMAHHWQRLLPPVLVNGLVRFFGSGQDVLYYKEGFRILSYLTFSLFSFWMAYFINRLTGHLLMSLALSLLILIQAWPMFYGVHNFFQLCDNMTLLFTLGSIWAVYRKKYPFQFIWGLLAIYTRQNLAILTVLTDVWFILQAYRSKKKVKCSSFLLPLVGLGVHIGAGLILLAISPVSTAQDTLWRHLSINIRIEDLKNLKVIYDLVQPFFFVLILEWKTLWRWSYRYWPIALFCLVTVYQPIAYYHGTGQTNLERILIQGLWPVAMAGSILLIRRILEMLKVRELLLGRVFLWMAILSPLFCGTEHMRFLFNFAFRPLLMLSPNFKNYIGLLFLAIMLYSLWHKKQASKA